MVDWKSGNLRFSDGIVWKTVKAKGSEEESLKRLKALVRMGKKEEETVWMCMVKELEIERIEGEEEKPEPVRDIRVEECKVLSQFADIFSEPSGVDRESRIQYRIQLRVGANAYRKAPYRMSLTQKEALKSELEDFLKKGWIRPSISEWAIVALVVPKKDGKP